jgi:hypothetical protein
MTNHFVSRTSIFFGNYGFVIRQSIGMRLSWLPRPTGLNQSNPLPARKRRLWLFFDGIGKLTGKILK